MRLKRVVGVVVAVTAAVLVAGYAMISSLDVQRVADFAKDEVKSATGRTLAVDGPVSLHISLTPSIDLQDLRFANASWGSRPDMVRLKRLQIEVELLPLLTGDVVVKRLVVVQPDVLLETDTKGRGNWDFKGAAPASEAPGGATPKKGPVTLPEVQDFRIEGGQLTMIDGRTGKTLNLAVTQAVGSVPSGGGPSRLHLQVAYNGNPVRLEGTYAGLHALVSDTPAPLDLSLEAGGATVTVKGTVGNLGAAPKADLAVTAAGQSLAGLSPLLGTTLPPLGPYKFSSNVKVAGKNIELSGLALQVGKSDLTGNAGVSLAGQRPLVTASLVSKLLDLSDFTAGSKGQASAAAGSKAGGGEERLFPDQPLPLDALRAVDAQVKMDAERLQVNPRLALDQVRFTLALKDGNLKVAPLDANLAGGKLDGSLALTGAQAKPDLAFSLKGSGIDFGKLLQETQVSNQVGGKLDLDVDVKGRGASPHAIASDLGGHVQAVSQNGTIDNALLSIFSAGLGTITGPLFGKADHTRLECLVVRFDIKQGQAESRALVLDTGAFAVAGRGSLDLAAERAHLAFDTQTSEPSLASLAVPFNVTGPLQHPSFVPNPIGAAADVVGTVGNVAKTGGNIVGGAVDTVGGLLGTGPIIGHIGSNQTLCGEALAAIGQGGQAGSEAPAPKSSEGVAGGVGNAVKDVGEGIQKGLKSLFGN